MGRDEYQSTPEDDAWRARRFYWYGFQVFLFVAIVYRVGPNLILFHSPFSPGQADFAAWTNQYTPMIAAIKAYQRDYGGLPMTSEDLPPEYLKKDFHTPIGEIDGTTSITFPHDQSVMEYEFSRPVEGWKVHSPWYDGPVAAPIVAAAPKPVAPSPASPTTSASNGK